MALKHCKPLTWNECSAFVDVIKIEKKVLYQYMVYAVNERYTLKNVNPQISGPGSGCLIYNLMDVSLTYKFSRLI